MRAAPSVSVRCSGGAGWRSLQSGLHALAAAASGIWALQWAQLPTAWAAILALLVASLAWRQAARTPVDLVWDGQRWTADGQPGRLDVMLDIGPALLLRLRPDQGRRHCWIAVTAAEAGPALHGLRVAAYHRPPEPSRPGAPVAPAGG